VLLLAVGEVWGMCGVVGRVLRAVEGPRGAAVGSSASLLQRTEKMGASRGRHVVAGSLVSLHRGGSQWRNFMCAVEGNYPPTLRKRSSTDKKYAT